jgi:trigger factor
MHAVSHQGISKEGYLQFAGKTEDELIAEAAPDAERALRREAVLAAIAAAERLEPTEEDMLEAVQAAAPRDERVSPKKLLERLRSNGRLDALRDDLAQRKALELVAESATPISVEQAKARDKLWTPGSDDPGGGSGQLWTPGS